jgi:PEP-CTERM motif
MIRKKLIATAVSAALMGIGGQAMAQLQGPSSSQTAYVKPTASGWTSMSIITVGDTVVNTDTGISNYKMVGIPDGLGAYDNGNGTFTVLMNHELGAGLGIARAHGSNGGFVSEWIINKSNFGVVSARDLATTHLVSSGPAVNTTWVAAAGAANTFNRLCSADLPAVSAFYNSTTGMGTQNRIFMNGEETGNEGRAYAFVATGPGARVSYELPKLGKFSWENSVANPFTGNSNKTVVIGMDDSTPGQVYVYTGTKTNVGNDVQRAGLDNGTLRGIKVNVAAAQGGASGNLEQGQINGAFTTVAVNTDVSGALQQTNSRASGITEFARPEDGHWADAKTFYFVTTGADPDGGGGPVGTQTSRLYKLTFNEVAGVIDYDNGTTSLVLDASTLLGTDGAVARSFDNMTVGATGEIFIQEDPGNSSYIAKTWMYDPATGTTTQIMESDRARFLAGGASFLTQDEESSGVIEITDLLQKNDGLRYFLGDMQAHYGIAGELVEGGQLYVMSAPVPEPESYAMMLAGLGVLGYAARRRRNRK